jgi:hypothetical protein
MSTTEQQQCGIRAIAAALRTLSPRFATVRITTPGEQAPGADELPAALVALASTDDQDLTDPVLLLRRHNFTLRIVVREEDPDRRQARLQKLARYARWAIRSADLGFEALPALTRFRTARVDPTARAPEAAWILEGEWTTIDDPSGDGAEWMDP